MLIVLSPAKKLLNSPKPSTYPTTQPLLIDKSNELAQLMKSKSVEELATLMSLSKDLASLNYKRYQDFSLQDSPASLAYPALFLFQGDVYQALAASSWGKDDVDYAQLHLGVLSGLYGFLKPLDRIQPYRLEMGVSLSNSCGSQLYAFWRNSLTKVLNQQLALQDNPLLINLASSEYFKAVDANQLNYPIVTINFYEKKNNELKMIGVHAKKARGTMAKFLIQNQIDNLDELKTFNELGYEFNSDSSTDKHIDFVRAH